MRTDGWDDLINPFTYLGNAAGKVAADAWTAAMLALWNGGLWLLRLVLGFIDTFATPDLRESGPMAERLPDHVLGGRHPGHRAGDGPVRGRRVPPRRARPGPAPGRRRPVRHGLGRVDLLRRCCCCTPAPA